ncbi:uncharacterized protein LOC104858368 isoform X2 [Fukomys damarensis]|uniref:uncharacterized protein LOC104858368 isoform X2 n=1 Tax=Fukomys damarensis TaxID=885580 RepID=UPI00053F36A1|nr:uncharacterized protein LOC104858368 isoform X2 [Fukomys damarensis]
MCPQLRAALTGLYCDPSPPWAPSACSSNAVTLWGKATPSFPQSLMEPLAPGPLDRTSTCRGPASHETWLLRPGEAPRGSHLLPGPAPLSRSWVGNSSSSPSRLSAWPTTDFAARVELRRTQHGSCTQTPLKSSLSEQQVHPLTLLGFTLSGKSAFLEMLGDTAALDKKIVSTPRQSHVRGLFSSGCYRSREAEGDL